ncbi:MAG: CsgG/HfaB family protein, partial [Prevotellaceae bacterium]|nr:CsgG/HfaB family protein [Prevotellaceae bacterium]
MKKILILGTFILWYGGIFAQDKKVAVFDPDGKAGKSAKEIIREEVSNVIVNTRGYAVLERQQIDKVLAENKFQMSGQVDNAQIVAIGKKIGANAVFVTNATELHDELRMPYLYISFKLIDVQTGRVEKQKTAKTRGESDIDVVVR